MALTLGKSPVKPARWDVKPHLTAEPEMWLYAKAVFPCWDGSGSISEIINNNNSPTLESQTNVNWVSTERGPSVQLDNGADGHDDLGVPVPFESTAIYVYLTVFQLFNADQTNNDFDATFIRHNDPGVSTDGCNISVTESGSLFIFTQGSNTTATPTKTVDDGEPHTAAVMFDQVNGRAAIAIDGELQFNNAYSDTSSEPNASFGPSTNQDRHAVPVDVGFAAMLDMPYQPSDQQLERWSNDLFAMIRPGPQIIPLFFGDAGAAGTTINATTATLTTATNTASLSLDKTLSAALATLTLSEQQSTLSLDKTINAATSSLAISGNGATLSLDTAIAATLATLSTSTNSASLSLDKTVSANTANLTTATNPASLSLDIDVAAQTASLSLASQSGSISLGKQISASSATLSLAEQTASILADTVIDAQSASITASGQQATTSIDLTVSASTASLLLQSFASSVESATLIDANTASVTINALTVTIDTGGPGLLSGTVTVNAALDGTITLQSALDGTITLQ